MQNIKNIIFDYGNVIFLLDFGGRLGVILIVVITVIAATVTAFCFAASKIAAARGSS